MNAAAFHIRTATPEDAALLAPFAAHMFSTTFGYLYAPEHLQAHLEKTCSERFFRQALQEGDTIVLALDGEALAGYAKCGALGLPVTPAPGHAAELHRLYVAVPHQAQGVGKRLMQAALDAPPMQGKDIYLGVWENNLRAQRFYASFGFVVTGEYQYHVGPHRDRELIMIRRAAAQGAPALRAAPGGGPAA